MSFIYINAWNMKMPRFPVPVSVNGNGIKRVGNSTKRVSGGWVSGNAGERKVSNSGVLQFKGNRFVQYWICISKYGGKKWTEKKGKGRNKERNQKKRRGKEKKKKNMAWLAGC